VSGIGEPLLGLASVCSRPFDNRLVPIIHALGNLSRRQTLSPYFGPRQGGYNVDSFSNKTSINESEYRRKSCECGADDIRAIGVYRVRVCCFNAGKGVGISACCELAEGLVENQNRSYFGYFGRRESATKQLSWAQRR
jgi:hypothetical protein